MSSLEPRTLFAVMAPTDLVASVEAGVAAASVDGAAPQDDGSRQIALGWHDNSSNETGFIIARSTDGTSFLNVAVCDADDTAFVDSSVIPGYTYYYRIYAANGSEMSDPSNTASATTAPVEAPAAPSNLEATLVKSGKGKRAALSASITWQDNSANETRFVLQRSTDGVNWTTWYVSGPNATSYTDTSVSSGRTYYYRVAAWNTSGMSDWSEVFVLKT